jgi:hypothetical protein
MWQCRIVRFYGVIREASADPHTARPSRPTSEIRRGPGKKTLHDSAGGAEYSALTIPRLPIKFYTRCDTARRAPPGSAGSPFIVRGIGQRTPTHVPRSLQVQYR